MNALAETITQDGEVITTALATIDPSLVSTLAKAEIDQQIATAHAYPRSIKKAVDSIMTLATLDEAAAEDCIYALPRGGKPIRGPSVRLAEIIAGQWRNNRVAARVTDVNRTEKYVEAEGVFHDLETNVATKAIVRRRIVDSKGRLYNDDMIIVTGNAACSIARRNAILAGVPKAVWNRAYVEAERVIKGDAKTLAETRAKAIAAFGTWGVKPEQLFAALGVAGEDEITLEHIPTLKGMFSAIKNGEATVEELFTSRGPATVTNFPKVENPLADKPAGKAEQKTNDEQPTTDQPTQESATALPADDEAEASETAPDEASASDQIDRDDADFQKGLDDAAAGKTKCLKPEIRENPERLAKWTAGHAAYVAQQQQAEGA